MLAISWTVTGWSVTGWSLEQSPGGRRVAHEGFVGLFAGAFIRSLVGSAAAGDGDGDGVGDGVICMQFDEMQVEGWDSAFPRSSSRGVSCMSAVCKAAISLQQGGVPR